MLAALGLLVLIPGVGGASCKLLLDCGTGGWRPQSAAAGARARDGGVGLQGPSAFAFLPDGRILVAQVNGPCDGARRSCLHDDGTSITGGEFRGRDEYVYGDDGRWWLRTLRLDADGHVVSGTDTQLTKGTSTPVQIWIVPQGDVYFLLLFDGTIYRLRSARQ